MFLKRPCNICHLYFIKFLNRYSIKLQRFCIPEYYLGIITTQIVTLSYFISLKSKAISTHQLQGGLQETPPLLMKLCLSMYCYQTGRNVKLHSRSLLLSEVCSNYDCRASIQPHSGSHDTSKHHFLFKSIQM